VRTELKRERVQKLVPSEVSNKKESIFTSAASKPRRTEALVSVIDVFGRRELFAKKNTTTNIPKAAAIRVGITPFFFFHS